MSNDSVFLPTIFCVFTAALNFSMLPDYIGTWSYLFILFGIARPYMISFGIEIMIMPFGIWVRQLVLASPSTALSWFVRDRNNYTDAITEVSWP
jgi:hypothetical protein